MITLYNPSGSILFNVEVENSSYRHREIMAKNELVLEFALPHFIEVPVGAYCTYEGERYEALTPSNIQMRHTRNYRYTLTLESQQGKLRKYRLHDNDGRVVFPLTASPRTHIELIIKNINERENGSFSLSGSWNVGNIIDAEQRLITYNNMSLLDALTEISNTFETEWEVVGTTINLRKVEYNVNNPLALSYANGFKANIERSNSNSLLAIGRLYVQGGERNIVYSHYPSSSVHSKTLLLPRIGTFKFDGQHFQGETGYNNAKAKTMVVDSNGYSVAISGAGSTAVEDSLDLSNIYPKRVGTVTAVWYEYKKKYYTYESLTAKLTEEYGSMSSVPDEVWEKQVFCDIIDNTIPADLDFWDDNVRIANQIETVIFQSGSLAGKEFNVSLFSKAEKTDSDEHTIPGNRFELQNQEIDGYYMPSTGLRPSVGNTYAVFNVNLPNAYLNAFNSQTGQYEGAERDMLREAAKYLYEHSTEQHSYRGSLSGIWSKDNWGIIAPKIKLGGYINFTDPVLAPNGYNVRIKAVTDYVNNPYSPELTLSNDAVAGSVSSGLRHLENNATLAEVNVKDARDYTKRSFRDAKETAEMLEEAMDSLSERWTSGINPITARMMQLLVGDEGLQFHFVNDNNVVIPDSITYNPETKILSSPASRIKHFTLGIDTTKPQREEEEYKHWDISSFESEELEDPKKKYYIYAICGKDTEAGYLDLLEEPLDFDGGTVYNLLVGILNSEYEEYRSIARLYGFTEILPSQVTSYKFSSPDNLQYLDYLAKKFRIGSEDKYLFADTPNEILRVKGLTIVSGDGTEEQMLGVYRGAYNATTTYFEGDTVTYNGSTYICMVTSVTGIDPTNTDYWQPYALKGTDGQPGQDGQPGKDGDNGVDGKYTEYRYAQNGSTSEPPELNRTAVNPDGWSVTMPTPEQLQYIWMTKVEKNADGSWIEGNQWSVPVRITGYDGINGGPGPKGDTGPAGPSGVYRGIYSNSSDKVYYGYSRRCDIVKYGNAYYIARLDAPNGEEGFNVIPTNTDYWNDFGANFESIATGLLFAELAYIDNLGVRNLQVQDENGNIVGAFIPATNGNNYPLWIGGTSATSASTKFKVDKDGKVYASDGSFAGTLNAGNHTEGSVTTYFVLQAFGNARVGGALHANLVKAATGNFNTVTVNGENDSSIRSQIFRESGGVATQNDRVRMKVSASDKTAILSCGTINSNTELKVTNTDATIQRGLSASAEHIATSPVIMHIVKETGSHTGTDANTLYIVVD